MQKDRILKLAKGFRGRAKNCIRIARERVEKALQYSYRDRRNKKRDMRSLWIQRINAGTRQHGVEYIHVAVLKEYMLRCDKSRDRLYFPRWTSVVVCIMI
nr:50s ribosomal protein l20 [Quercus suber]